MVVSMEKWSGKVAIVTGCSSGIGVAIAQHLVHHGLKVVGLARRLDRLEQLASQLSGKKGKFHAIKCDISQESDILQAFSWIKSNLGAVHVLVNNAGVFREGNLLNGTLEDWRTILDVNVLGLCLATREAVKSMSDNNVNGHIIHINSVAGHKIVNFPNMNIYPASKYAVTALTETLINDLKQVNSKIKVTSVSPGLVKSEMTVLNTKMDEERLKAFKQMPILDEEDIADGVVYALSTPPHVQIQELTIRPVGEQF